MKRDEIKSIQKDILNEVKEALSKVDDVVDFVSAEETGYDCVVVEHENLGMANDIALGQYYFIPSALEESDMEQFMILLTISDEIDDARKGDMLQATAYVNFLLPMGAFVMDPGLESISYKRTVSLRTEAPKEDTVNMIGYEIFESLNLVDLFIAPLIAYMNQDVTWDEFIEACVGMITPSEA